MTMEHIQRDADGQVRVPQRPGLGITPQLDAVERYLVDAEIKVAGRIIYQTPDPRE
jgi:L-alanine-DL-glutamate epimerase-like enolase superfamily enzyme